MAAVSSKQPIISMFTLCLVVVCCMSFIKSEELKSCKEWYQEGETAYLEEKWQNCIDYMTRAMEEYNILKKNIIRCRMKCKEEANNSKPGFSKEIEDLHFFEKSLKNTLCLLKCEKKLKSEEQLSRDTIQIFEELKPYDYLQLCYFQKNMLQQAANAAFTCLVANLNHSTMLSNLKFYSTLPEVDVKEIKNYEEPRYVSLYVHGSDAYSKKDYENVIHYFEESLIEYLQAEEECRAYCEGPFDQGWFPEFIPSIANHFTYVLKCKRNCVTTLSNLNGESHSDILPSHYHYLQFAYFKVGKLKEACEATKSYLLFYPIDESMLENVDFYKTQPEFKKEFLKAREEIIKYTERQNYEIKILKFIYSDFSSKENSNNKVKHDEL